MIDELSDRIVSHVRAAAGARDRLSIAAAIDSVRPAELTTFLHHHLETPEAIQALAHGLGASPGAASGRIVVSAAAALDAGDRGQSVVLVRSETTPDDVLGMQASVGVLTARGGLASHAAVVARGWGIPAVVGAAEVAIDASAGSVTIGGEQLAVGDEITIDGSTGAIYRGTLATTGADAPPELETLLRWADDVARGAVELRTNADTADDANQGRRLGARGIGLCRTEHMFLAPERLALMRRYILATDPDDEAGALAELRAAQVADFEAVLGAMDGLPVTVRLLDPPLHEFLPDLVELTAREARGELDVTERAELAAARRLHEVNPMLGTRGVRLGVIRPGVYEMQVAALCEAAANRFERGGQPRVEIMIPLVVDPVELRIARSWVERVLIETGHPELAVDVVTIGAMVETPRAALVAGALAAEADFFSFGTNDLTQMVYAFSRDDVEARLLPAYRANGVLSANPFETLDQDGVGQLIQHAITSARAGHPELKIGICGEHAGDPASVEFLVRHGVDSFSCSPFRVPIARLAVAQALLASGRVRIDDVAFSAEPADGSPGGDGTSAGSGKADGVADAADSDADVAVSSGGEVEVDGAVEVDEAAVIHALRVRGFGTPDALEASLGVRPMAILEALVEAGFVNHVEARDLYLLLPAGKERHAELLPEIAPADIRAGLGPPYRRFLGLNDRFKALCTDWQVRDGEPNDHDDPAYDRACVDRLDALMSEAEPVLADLAAVLGRLGRYAGRLRVAADAVADGDTGRFTGVMCESYHDVWMELHEDLIVIQGIDRAAEGSF